jgi:hypothetical protein
MALLKTSGLATDAVDGSKFKLLNAQTLRARNFADNADVALFSLTAADLLVFNVQPTFSADPVNANDLTRKSWIDTQLGNKQSTSTKGVANGYAGLDASGFVPMVNIPPAAIERLVIVADQAARFALTITTIQNGDTVKQTDTGLMYFVKDDTQLTSAAGYEAYTAGGASTVAWSGVTGTPTTLAGYGITDYAAAAKAAAVANSITTGVTDVAPSQGAVFTALSLKASLADLIAVTNGKGASLIGIEDAAGKFTATNLEAALLELYNKAPSMGREVITLVALDITHGYVDLAQLAIANSLQVTPVGGILQTPGVDFTESNVSSKTRITFAGDLTSLVAGDKLVCYYVY